MAKIAVSADDTTESLPSGEIAVEIQGLTKKFGDRVVVDHLNLSIPTARVAAFVGPNGAGKSTTLRMLLGLIRPTEGTGRVLDGSIEDPQGYLSDIGALIEGPAFYPALSGEANLAVLCALGRIDPQRIPEVITMVGLENRSHDRVGRYSLGMKQRLGVAAALLPAPKLLILDEPTNGLDPAGIAAMRKLLRRMADSGVTVLVSSHQLSELQQIADWVIIINQGTLRYQGSLSPLLGMVHSTVIKPENPGDLDRLAAILRKASYEPSPSGDGCLTVELGENDSASTINRLAMEAGITLAELRTGQNTLEDVYFSMTAGTPIA